MRRNGTHINNKIIGVSAAGKHGENGEAEARETLKGESWGNQPLLTIRL